MSDIISIVYLVVSVLVGAGLVFFFSKSQKNKVLKPLLSFSGGFLLAIAFTHFIPEIYIKHQERIGIYILIGFLIQLLLEYFSGGIEHGHAHAAQHNKMPWALFISLSIHSILEGIPLESSLHSTSNLIENHNHSSEAFLLGVVLHKMPVAIALTTLCINSGWSNVRTLIIIALFACMSPLGIGIGHFAPHFIEHFSMDVLFAVVIGMFLHVSTTIVFETSEGHKFSSIKLFSLLLGATLAILMHG